jgi:16S rRNA (cytosine967-C5)-methyltransferase
MIRATRTERSSMKNRGAEAISPARIEAFRILARVEEGGAFAAVLLAAIGEHLSAVDRGLCHELVLGTLRWQLWLDRLIEHYSDRTSQSLDAPVRRALRLGLYQLRFLSRIPASAIVNESVNLTYRARVRSAGTFVNALLRRAARESSYDPSADILDPIEKMAVQLSHPPWLIKRWMDNFGVDETIALAQSNNQTPPAAFRLSSKGLTEGDVLEKLRAAGATLEPSRIVAGAWRALGATAALRALAQTGSIYIQDEGSQLVAHVLDPHPGERVLDVCAAPGSKTTLIAQIAGNHARVLAGDLHEGRLRPLLQAVALQQVRGVSVLTFDAAKPLPFTNALFDRVLVDAPCTGTGTLRRNPEIRWRISPSDIKDLAARQMVILSNAAQVVRPEGRLVYSTCSVEAQENEEVVASFAGGHASFRPVEMPANPHRPSTGVATTRLWPHREGSDGFFIAAFERER